ncbi:MAG: nucleoid-associated protein [Bacteroidetes bacterium]|nr:nucleoid-associated protein [Bacteroidota bacterium]
MTTLDLTNVKLDKLITHHVGNKIRDENVIISKETTEINEDTVDYLLKYFLSPFQPIDFYNFTHTVNLELNEVYMTVKKIFHDCKEFIPQSKNLANLLYEYSSHPKIKGGEFNIVLFNNFIFDGEAVNAIGLFKSENNVPFIKMNPEEINYSIEHEFGFELKGIDKGCIVFNKNEAEGFTTLVIDKSGDTQYWLNDFLKLKSCNDDYNKTKDFMSITKDFVTKKMPEEFDVSKTEKIDLLNRTVEYFKKNESFVKSEFEEDVFQNENVINSFREFDNSYRTENEIDLNDSFEISNQAVKKQSRKFKSILKLDKNFHVYIHGNKDLIEKGVESDGRKYYKIYYEKED